VATVKKNELYPGFFFTRIMKNRGKMTQGDDLIEKFVSKEFPLDDIEYHPRGLTLLSGASIDPAGRVSYIREEALGPLIAMAKDFERAMGRPLVVISTYRSAEKQQQLWDQ
jgi:LAS superfamily LD-carboxypeptidase LdcB